MLANHAPASNDSPQGDSDQSASDYDTILAALMESARGRSFLHEYALRNRTADTATLLTAIGRIEGLLTSRSLEPQESVAERVEVPAVEPVAIEREPTLQVAEIENVSVDIAATESFSVEATRSGTMPTEMAALEGTALHALAIEFLGPELQGLKPAPVEPSPRPMPAKAERRDPFADIRALSYEEKIALFT